MPFLGVACDKTLQEEVGNIDVQLEIPETINLTIGDTECSFRVMFDKAPLATDMLVFENTMGKKVACPINVSGKTVKVTLDPSIISGKYKIHLQRGEATKLLGETTIVFKSKDVELDPSTNVYGLVLGDGKPLKGVVVSDGYKVALTDDDGIYQLVSDKVHKYVFISIPSGYEVNSDGVFPHVFKQLKGATTTVENVNFELTKVEGQDNHSLIVMGDMHLANRNNDLMQYAVFTNEVNNYLSVNSGKHVYGITLGDMSWDCYWYDHNMDLSSYKTYINQIKGMQIFHAMGNHDHDMNMTGDFDTAEKYKRTIAPTYYSFNIGKVHYIVLDNIDCTNDGTENGRDYNAKIVKAQIDWLKLDLQHVSTDTPLVFAMHAPFRDVSNKNEVLNLISSYTKVHFLSGHTHKVTNYAEDTYMEHVSGAVCADWWWSGKNNASLLVSTDGAPGGYAIWDIAGTDFKWRYKATGKSEDYQFRTYDLNNVVFYKSDFKAGSDSYLTKYASAYPANSNNEVLINVWNWNKGWKIEVKDEKGNVLNTTALTTYDPLHIASRFVWESTTTNFETQKNGDYFKVTASDADVDLIITVTDEFGNTYTEKMQRPKAFTKETYK